MWFKRLSKLLQRKSKEFNIHQIALEEHMGCAMGVCYACVCDIKENDEIKSCVYVMKVSIWVGEVILK